MRTFTRLFTPLFALLLMAGCGGEKKQSSSDNMVRSSVTQPGFRSVTVDRELVDVRMETPVDGMPGVAHELKLHVMPTEHVANVIVHAFLSDDVDYERSSPTAHVQGNHLTWSFERMKAGDDKEISITVRPRTEGDVTHCATVEALPMGCLSTFIGTPKLVINKDGPERAILGSRIHYAVTVENQGNLVARDVRITDEVPKGLEDPGNREAIELSLGDMEPGAQRTVDVELIAAMRGRHCNLATARSANALQVSDEACTLVVEPRAAITKTGPSKSWVGKRATYQITVTNPGDTKISNIEVVDTAPMGTRIIEADGARVVGSKARWTVPSLERAESKTFAITLEGVTEGTHCNQVMMTGSDGVSARSEFCTQWQGHAALLIEVIDTEDPLLVGGMTTYRITVRNQGTSSDRDVFVVAEFPPGLTPMSVSGRTGGTIKNQMVRFDAYRELEPNEAIEWFVEVRAGATGDHRMKVDLFSELLRRPVTEEESTHVY